MSAKVDLHKKRANNPNILSDSKKNERKIAQHNFEFPSTKCRAENPTFFFREFGFFVIQSMGTAPCISFIPLVIIDLNYLLIGSICFVCTIFFSFLEEARKLQLLPRHRFFLFSFGPSRLAELIKFPKFRQTSSIFAHVSLGEAAPKPSDSVLNRLRNVSKGGITDGCF